MDLRTIKDIGARLYGNTGLYAWLSPNNISRLTMLAALTRYPHPEQLRDASEYHMTMIYYKGDLPDIPLPVFDMSTSQATVTGYEVWNDHKDRSILVARLDYQPALSYIRKLAKLGIKHSYDDIKLHITLAKGVTVDQEWVDANLVAPFKIVFDRQLFVSPIS